MVQDEALAALRSFLGAGGRAGYRKVLVIHGKGLHSEKGKAVLKEAVQQALRKDRNVSAWGEAGRKEGGQGASWVWLSARGR
jgi:DNA-nicking Smr family endonuclease